MGSSTRAIVVPFKVESFVVSSCRERDMNFPKWLKKMYFSEIGHGWRQIGEAAARRQHGKLICTDVLVKIPPEVVKQCIIEEDDDNGEGWGVKTDEDYEMLVKNYPCVEILNESEYAAGGDENWSVISDNRDHLEMFCKDMEVEGEILENAAVQQTL